MNGYSDSFMGKLIPFCRWIDLDGGVGDAQLFDGFEEDKLSPSARAFMSPKDAGEIFVRNSIPVSIVDGAFMEPFNGVVFTMLMAVMKTGMNNIIPFAAACVLGETYSN